MNEVLLSEAMHEATADLHPSPALLPNARAATRRRRVKQAASLGVVAVAAGSVATLAPHHHPAGLPAAISAAPRVHTVAFVAKRLSATIADEDGYVINSVVTGEGTEMDSWIDPSTGNRRLLVKGADGQPTTAIGVTVDGGTATLTALDYATRTVTTSTQPASDLDSDSRLGVNVPSPDAIRAELGNASLVSKGVTDLNGQQVYQLQMPAPIPVGSERWAAGTDVELYVDATTYQLVRTTISEDGNVLWTDDLTWNKRSAASTATTKESVPRSFTTR